MKYHTLAFFIVVFVTTHTILKGVFESTVRTFDERLVVLEEFTLIVQNRPIFYKFNGSKTKRIFDKHKINT